MLASHVDEDVLLPQVQYLECVDVMIKQLVRRLHQAEANGQGQYAICVTGDHSTPVLFGDHSHEPVPFTISHIRHVVSYLSLDLLHWYCSTNCLCSVTDMTALSLLSSHQPVQHGDNLQV